jgi:predicted dehydrogenase
MNVALLGYGFAGRTLHAPLILGIQGLRLTTVMSSRIAQVKEDLPGIAVVSSAEAVFADRGVELVVIATPNDSHYDLARRALEAGKHVVVDKPFTVTVEEAQELTGLANESGRLLSVFHNRRWDADFLTVRQLIASGELGDVVHFESHYDRYRPVVQKRWRESAGPGSGIWFDLGAHLADQALELFGPPDDVQADLEAQRSGAVAVDYFHVLLRYGRMRVVLHGSNLVAETVRRFEVHGTKGSFVKYGMDAQEDALKRGERPGSPGWGTDPDEGVVTTWVEGAREVRRLPMIPGNYRLFYEAVRDAAAGRGRNPVPPEQALATMTVLNLAVESAVAGRALAFSG